MTFNPMWHNYRGSPNKEEARFSSDGAVRLRMADYFKWFVCWCCGPSDHASYVGRDRLSRLLDAVGF